MRDKQRIKERKSRDLDWQERIELIEEYLTGKYTKNEIWEKYTGQKKEHGQILRWMRKLNLDLSIPIDNFQKEAILEASPTLKKLSDYTEKETSKEQLEKQVKELKKQLEFASIQAEGYKLMIDLAEKEYKISIQKKSDTR